MLHFVKSLFLLAKLIVNKYNIFAPELRCRNWCGVPKNDM